MRTVTLTLEDDKTLDVAERNAAAAAISLSTFVERALVRENERRRLLADLPPITRELAGSLPPMSDEEADGLRREHLARKHG